MSKVTMSERREYDFYPTPEGVVRVLFERVHNIGGIIAEPCCGDGGMVREIMFRPNIYAVAANDIDPTRDAHYHSDARHWMNEFWGAHKYNWVITNPPYNQAIDILKASWVHAQNVAMLLRLSFLEPTLRRGNRGEWLQEHADNMTHLIPLSQPRPDFTGDGGDSMTTAWFVWEKSHSWKDLGIVPPFQFATNWRTR